MVSANKRGPVVSVVARGLLALALVVSTWAVLAPDPAAAQDRELRAMRERVEDLESQLRSITRYLSNNEDAPRDYDPGGGAAGSPDQMANIEVRLNALENQIRELTGQVEEAQHQARRAMDRLDRLAEDYEFRLQQLEGGGAPLTGGSDDDGADAPEGLAEPLPDGPPGDQAEGQGGDAGAGEPEPLPTGEPTEVYNAALAKLRQDNFREAAQGFDEFILQFPDHELTPNAQYWLGEAYYARQDYSEAARAFLTAYTDYPESSKASGALLKLGISLGELDQKQDACAALREFSQKYPNASPIEANRAQVARQDLNCP